MNSAAGTLTLPRNNTQHSMYSRGWRSRKIPMNPQTTPDSPSVGMGSVAVAA